MADFGVVPYDSQSREEVLINTYSLPPAELTIWLLSVSIEAYVVYLFVSRSLFRRFLFLAFYFSLSCVTSLSRFAVISRFGAGSDEYMYLYFSTDALLRIVLFLGVSELAARLLNKELARKIVVLLSAGAFLSISLFIFFGVPTQMRFVQLLFELSDNIFFACCLAIFLLWGWQLFHNPADRIAAQFARVLGVYAAQYVVLFLALQFVSSNQDLSRLPTLMMAAWLPLGCGFAIACEQ